MEMGRWGSIYPWQMELKWRRWFEVDNYVRVNKPGQADGVIRAFFYQTR